MRFSKCYRKTPGAPNSCAQTTFKLATFSGTGALGAGRLIVVSTIALGLRGRQLRGMSLSKKHVLVVMLHFAVAICSDWYLSNAQVAGGTVDWHKRMRSYRLVRP